MSLLNNCVDIGDMLFVVDENYDEDTNRYNMSVLEADVEDVDAGDPDIDEDVYDAAEDDGGDDYFNVMDRMAIELADDEKNWADIEVDDDVMDMIIDDEEDDMDEEDIDSYNEEYGIEDTLDAVLDESFEDEFDDDADLV